MNNKINLNFIYNFNLLNLLIGFVLITFIPSLTDAPQREVNIIYRGFSLVVAVAVLVLSFDISKVKSKYFIVLLSFWFLYVCKMLYSFYIVKLSYELTGFEYLTKAIGITLIPSLSIYFTPFNKIKVIFISKLLYIALLIVALINVIPYKLPLNYGRSSGILDMYPIAFGHIGASLALLSFYFFFNPLTNIIRNHKKVYDFMYVFSFIVGVAIIIISGSRGSFISLMGGVIIYSIYNRKLIFNKVTFKSIAVFTLLIFVFGIIILKVYNSSFLDRSLNVFFGVDESANIRLNIWRESFQKFIENPFFGNTFLMNFNWNNEITMVYSHNWILESFYTMGIIGGLLFLIMCLLSIRIALKLIVNSNYSWVSLYFLQYFLLSFLSSSIYSNDKFWTITALLFSYAFFEKNENQDFKHQAQ